MAGEPTIALAQSGAELARASDCQCVIGHRRRQRHRYWKGDRGTGDKSR
jgi:hypothetical protein